MSVPVLGEQDPCLSVPHASLAWPGLAAGNRFQDEEELNAELKAGGQRGARAAVCERGGKCSRRVSTCFFQREVSQGLNATGSPVGRDRGNKAHKGQLAIMSYQRCKKKNQKENCNGLKHKNRHPNSWLWRGNETSLDLKKTNQTRNLGIRAHW